MTSLTQAQRAALIRAKHARLDRIEAERRQVLAELLPLESRHAADLGMPTLRGRMLLGEMGRRDLMILQLDAAMLRHHQGRAARGRSA